MLRSSPWPNDACRAGKAHRASATPSGPPPRSALPAPFIIAGPTASGKSALAVALARLLGKAHVVNADPFQAWQGMSTLTAQPSLAEQSGIPHHLFDCLPPTEDRDAAGFSAMIVKTIGGLAGQGITPIVVSGSGLYLRAVAGGLDSAIPSPDPVLRAILLATPLPALLEELQSLDPEEFSRIDRKNPRRVVRAVEICRLSGQKASSLRQSRHHAENVKTVGISLEWNAVDLRERIQRRAAAMFCPALADELDHLASLTLCTTASQTLGLAVARAWRAGTLSTAAATDSLATQTWQYARRQRTWFRKAGDLAAFPIAWGDTPDDAARRVLAAFGA